MKEKKLPETLTVDRIARDLHIRAAALAYIILTFDIAFLPIFTFLNGWEGLGSGWIPVSAVAALCLPFILRAVRLGHAIRSGDFYLICSPLNGKVEDSFSDSDTYTFYFNLHGETRYEFQTSYSLYEEAEVGDLYYLVLRQNKIGTLKTRLIYPANSTRLDSYLSRKLREDALLTGEAVSLAEEQDRKYRANFKAAYDSYIARREEAAREVAGMSSHQLAAARKKYTRLIRQMYIWELLSPVMGLVCFAAAAILLRTELPYALWYWKLLYTLVHLLLCIGPWVVVSRLQHRFQDLRILLLAAKEQNIPDSRKHGCLYFCFIFLTITVYLCSIPFLLSIWGIM